MNDATAPNSDSTDARDAAGGPDAGPGESGSSRAKRALAWAVTVVSAIVVLFVFGYLLYTWATHTDEGASLTVSLDAPRASGSTVEITVTVRNDGPRVAEAAVIEVCAGPENCGHVTFDYVPFDSRVTGAVGLERPLASAPTSRVVSYHNP